MTTGFWLTLTVLFILFVFVCFLSIKFTFTETDAAKDVQAFKQHAADSVHLKTFENEYKVILLLQTEKKNSRDFLFQMAQLVLVNVLLPVITALLGYMFGSEKKE